MNWSWTKRIAARLRRLDLLDRRRLASRWPIDRLLLGRPAGRTRRGRILGAVRLVLDARQRTPARWDAPEDSSRRAGPAESLRAPLRLVQIARVRSGDRERQPELRVGEVPAVERLDPADPVGERVAVDARARRRLGRARGASSTARSVASRSRHGRPGRPPSSGSRSAAGLAQPVGQVVQAAQQPVGGQPVRPGDGRRLGERLGRLERRARLGLRRPAGRAGLGERARDRHDPAEERRRSGRRAASPPGIVRSGRPATSRSSRLSASPRSTSRRAGASRRSSRRGVLALLERRPRPAARPGGRRGRPTADRRPAAPRRGGPRRGPAGRPRRGRARGRGARRSARPRPARAPSRAARRGGRGCPRRSGPPSAAGAAGGSAGAAAGHAERDAARPGQVAPRRPRRRPGRRRGAWTASASPRRPSSATARPRNAADRRDERRRGRSPARASRSSRRLELRPPGRSSSARRLTRKPMTLRSSAAGSTPASRKREQPGRDRPREPRAPGRAAGVGGRRPRRGGAPATRARASAVDEGRRSPPAPGATTARAPAGTIARSPGSRASNAGTRAFRTRTQPTSRSRAVAASGATGRAPEERRAEVGDGGHRRRGRGGRARAALAHRPRTATAGSPAAGPRRRRDGDEVVEQPPELALEVDVAVGAADDRQLARRRLEPRPDPPARQVERDDQPDDERAEREPDEPLARDPAWR